MLKNFTKEFEDGVLVTVVQIVPGTNPNVGVMAQPQMRERPLQLRRPCRPCCLQGPTG